MKRGRTYAVLLAAAALLAVGLMQGQQHQVLTKAIHICLECIGVG
jgi:hypothetical protein